MSSKNYSNINSEIKGVEKLSRIKEVYNDNFVEEMGIISSLIEKFNHIAMDTEFPGVVISGSPHSTHHSSEYIYKNIKQNVDCLKLIQLGITLSDKNGCYPEGVCTWQFNVDFDLKEEKYNQESINLLINSGINFNILPKCGISIESLGELFLTSGLILNDNICWISYHGSYDFAYFLKFLTGQTLPGRLDGFMSDLEFYFKNYYDIRYLVKDELEGHRLSLSKLANDLQVEIVGTQHQAGSDSMVTSKVYYKVRQNIITEMGLITGRNKLFSLSNECDDDEDDDYFQVQNQDYSNMFNNYQYNMGNMNNMNNMGYQGYENNFLFNGSHSMPGMNSYQFYNMMINNPIKNLSNCVVPAIFNSGGSTTSGGSYTQQVPVVKKKKSKKEKKKKAKKVV